MGLRKAMLRQVQGVTFAARADSNHWVMMDGSDKAGGSNAGSTPKELLLMALGGCTGADVASILAKKQVPVASIELRLTANTAEEHPQVYTDIQIEYVIYGHGIDPNDVERAIELSTTKYCSVSAMLRPSVQLSHTYRIEPVPAGSRTT